jgi:hypothetical protein
MTTLSDHPVTSGSAVGASPSPLLWGDESGPSPPNGGLGSGLGGVAVLLVGAEVLLLLATAKGSRKYVNTWTTLGWHMVFDTTASMIAI